MAPPSQADTEQHPAATGHTDAERRQITALCCELVGVAAGADGAGLENLRAAVAAFQRCISETAGRHHGSIHRHLGNNVLVLFGYPATHEHDAEQAVRAGLELCNALGASRPDAGAPMRCRVGIATGLAIIGGDGGKDGPGDHEIVGDVADLALRLQLSAQPGTIRLDQATRRLVGDLFDCRELAAIDPNGDDEPLRNWQVLAESTVASRFEALHPAGLTPLVGREEEIDFLLRRWRRAESGEGQVVLLSGEPGIGKSRIAAALLDKLESAPHTHLPCFCSPHHTESAFHPAITHLEYAAGFERDDSPAARREKLERLLAQTAATAEETALFAELLSLPAGKGDAAIGRLTPRQKRERTFAALLRRLAVLAQGAPVAMLFEDVHWADPSSAELLDRVVERIAQLPVLLVITFRPEYHPPWTGLPHAASLSLTRLGRRETALLAEQAVGGMVLPDEVVARIADHADGVPLHVEELTRSVVDSGLLRIEAERWVLDGPLPPFAIPATLHASLAARLDRVAAARRVAAAGAAIGRQFSYELTSIVSGLSEEELQAALGPLVAAGLLAQRGAPPDAVYTFKHALVQQAAYDGLLRKTRQQLHARIAEALEAASPDLKDTQPELLAQHYAEAGLVEKSVTHWGKAGHRSASRSAMAEAAAQLQKGLDQLALLPDTPRRQRQELEFCSALGAALRVVKGQAAPEVGQVYARAVELWEQLGSPMEFLHIPYARSYYQLMRGEFDSAQRLDEALLRLSEQRDDSAGRFLGHFSCGRTLMLTGRFSVSRSHLEAALGRYDPVSCGLLVHQTGFDPRVTTQVHLGIVLCCLGYPEQALAQVNAATAEARRLGHPPSLAVCVSTGGIPLMLVGDNRTLSEWTDALAAVAEEHGFSLWRAAAFYSRGWIKIATGDACEGMRLLNSAAAYFRATGAQAWMPFLLGLLAKGCEIAGRTEEAARQLEDGLQIVARTGERWFAAELYRHKGELLLRQGHAETAEELYREALDVAREQEAKLWELRAAVSLARLWWDQRRRGEARDLLTPVYGWFTEGFATPDLKEAKALLGEIG